MTLAERPFEVNSGPLRLDGRLHEGAGRLSVLVLHPHPQFGGDMDNHVVVAACEAFAASRATTLRFNFRGVGRSTGAHDGAAGEADDARAALAALRALRPDAAVALAGYSFGATVAASIADAGLGALILISPPVAVTPLPPVPAGLQALLLTGERDELAPSARLQAMVTPSSRLVIVPGAGHGWSPGLDPLSVQLRATAAELARGNLLPTWGSCR
ncbi:MAG TPA: alpha/beta fold hydrolase [Dehalococcoidia bacterium]|nr:alpha/beta fold hydrolase [Dehalococcoidia bacterium]